MNKLLLTGLALSALTLGGCTPAQNAEIQEDVAGVRQQVNTATVSAQQAAADAALEAKVKAVLTSRKGLNASAIDVDASGDRVILKGDVTGVDQAQLAEQVAMEVEGVGSVENQLTMRVPATAGTTTGTGPGGDTTVTPGTGTGYGTGTGTGSGMGTGTGLGTGTGNSTGTTTPGSPY